MKKRAFSFRKSVVALASTVALTALMTVGVGTAFADNELPTDSVTRNLASSSAVAEGSYGIYNATDMATLDTYVENGGSTAGVVFNLKDNVTLDEDWNGIGYIASAYNDYNTSTASSDSKSFDGYFYGNGFTITLKNSDQGVFAFLGISAEVSNFTVAQAEEDGYGVQSDSTSDYFGAVAGYSRGKIENVANEASVYAPNAYNVGGIVGFNDGYNVTGKTYVKGCINKAEVTGKQKVGGIAGENAGAIALCENGTDAQIIGTNTSSKNGVGGIAGRNGNNNTARETGIIISCVNRGTVGSASQKWVGGITGFQNSKSSVTGCFNTGTIVAGAGYYNPIVGKNEGSTAGSYYYPDSLNHSSSVSNTGECGILWAATDAQPNLSSVLNNARNATVVQNACWSGLGSEVTLSRTGSIVAPTNVAIGNVDDEVVVYLDGSDGDDSYEGTASRPVQTLSKAAQLVSKGGNNSKIVVLDTVTVSSDVTIRQNITIQWAGEDNGIMFNVTNGTLVLGGDIVVNGVVATEEDEEEVAAAVAFNLTTGTSDSGAATNGKLIVQDGTSISAGEYAAKVANGSTMSINRSNIGSPIYLYSGGLLNLPSELSSNINVECASLSTTNINIATCGNDNIALANISHITVQNTGASLSTKGSIIKCKLSSSTPSSISNALSLGTLDAARETVYEWNIDKPSDIQYLQKGLPDGWKGLRAGNDSSDGSFFWGFANNANVSTSGKAWITLGHNKTSYGKNDDEQYYAMPSSKINLGANSQLTFEALYPEGTIVDIYVADDNSSVDNFTLVQSVTIGTKGNTDSEDAEIKTVDLSKYTGEKYVIFGLDWRKQPVNEDPWGKLIFGNIKITSEVASKDPAMTLTTDAKDLKVGDEVTVNVDMENITAYGQGTFSCSDNLTLKSIEAGSALKFDGTDGFESTVDNKLFSFFNNTGTEDGTVAKATFTCTKAGDATVSLAGVKAGAALDPSEPEELTVADLKLSVGLNALAGDVNNSGKVNIVDAQVTYDMVKGNYADGSEARTNLLKCWNPDTTGATYDLIVNVANVNGDELTASDAFAIQYFVHYGKFGEATLV